MDERVIHFCRAPSGLWIGWIVKDNAHYWGSGRTMDDLVVHVKNTLYQAKKCSTAGYIIASRPSTPDEVPLNVMGQNFKTRAWYGGTARAQEAVEKAMLEEEKRTKQQEIKDTVYDYYEAITKDGVLTVYGIIKKEVATYKLKEPQIPVTSTLHLDDKPVMVPLVDTKKMELNTDKGVAGWKPRETFPKD